MHLQIKEPSQWWARQWWTESYFSTLGVLKYEKQWQYKWMWTAMHLESTWAQPKKGKHVSLITCYRTIVSQNRTCSFVTYYHRYPQNTTTNTFSNTTDIILQQQTYKPPSPLIRVQSPTLPLFQNHHTTQSHTHMHSQRTILLGYKEHKLRLLSVRTLIQKLELPT